MMWEGSDRSRTRWLGDVRAVPVGGTIVLPLRWEGSAFKLTCGFVPEEDFAEDCLDGIFGEREGGSERNKRYTLKCKESG